MNFKFLNRPFLSTIIFVFYLIPLLFFVSYSINLMSPNKSWTILSLGLLIVASGTLILILLLSYWEKFIQERKASRLVYSSENPIIYASNEKEDKVTSLNSSVLFNQIAHHEPLDQIGFKENTREINLLQIALKANQEQQELLTKSLEYKSQELNKQEEENKQLQLKAKQINQDFADYKLFSEEQLKQKQLQIMSLQQFLEDQRTEMEKRQDQIQQLDTKVHDLSYEIKTLLYLHEEENQPSKSSIKEQLNQGVIPVLQHHQEKLSNFSESLNEALTISLNDYIHNAQEAYLLLKKCIQTAQKFIGSNYHHNESSRYREFSSSYYAIDQRRLFDSLRNENGALIVVYSQKDQRLLFINPISKTLLGWSPEKLMADFTAIMQGGIHDWKKALNALNSSTTTESQTRLLAKTKNGQEILLNCHLGIIPSGLFRDYIIAILYPTQ